LAFTVAVLASCSQLVGLDNLEPDAEEGNGGTGLSSGATGGDDDGGSNSSGGKGGSSGGKGGTGGSSGGRGGTGGSGGTGGTESKGGEDSSGGSISDGGTKVTAGTGGVSGSGGSTVVPEFDIPEDCAEIIELTSLGFDDVTVNEGDGSVNFLYLMSPSFGSATEDYLDFEIYSDGSYNGDQTGTFEIDGGADANYATCSRCLMAYEDDGTDPNFFAMGGTITVASDSDHMTGQPNITLTDVTLVESVVLLELPYTSTPVENARCLHIASALLNEGPPPLPPGWTCSEDYWTDDYCDCGCGAHDDYCETNDLSECFGDCNCETGYVCSTVDSGLCVPE
jgi:hypothetical protein